MADYAGERGAIESMDLISSLPDGILHHIISFVPTDLAIQTTLFQIFSTCNIPDESAAKILSGCPVLESLALNSCKMLGRLDLSESMHVTRLEIDHGSPDSGPREIVAPHIHYLRLETTNTPPCSLDHVSSLTEAKLNLIPYWGNTIAAGFLRVNGHVTKTAQHREAYFGINVLSVSELSGVPFPTLKIKDLTLETGFLRYFVPSDAQLRGVPGIAELLRNSPELKKLTLNLYKSRIVRSNVQENYLRTYIDSRGLKFEVVPASSEPKLIALFIELVLGNRKTLETLVVRLRDNLDAERFDELRCFKWFRKFLMVSRL
ncbi:unnamed protein product [Microthlaspi erraticum]|uniref:FBD domain-containing protein n=1 Tax=Microthlaspi erraticum TaxID=1685480 RepID=A0A6D2J7L6_9BRAS|nr:unnamed protein product [Microthlaspi erraticum]